MWALGNYLMQLWSPLQVAAPLSQVPNPQWRWLWQAWPCHLSGSGHPPQLGSKQTLQKTVTWHWCVVQNSGNQHSIGCQIPVTSHKWQPLEGSHDRQLAHHVENLLKRFYFSLLWVSKGYCWWGLKKGNPTIMYSLFCSQEQEIYVSNLVHLWSSYVRQGRGGACLYTHSSGKTSQTPRSGVHSISARIRFVCCMNVGSTGPCVPLDFRRGMREAWTADTELWDPFHRLRKV